MIQYRFRFEDENEKFFEVNLPRKHQTAKPPDWTLLDFEKCENCPLQKEERCPIAIDISQIVETFADALSYKSVQVVVHQEERSVAKTTDLQTALSSLMGVVMASSECPHMLPLYPMAKHHLPFATQDETTVRAVGYHLTQQYLAAQRGETPDFTLEKLAQTYDSLQGVNRGLTQRLRSAATRDATLNAVVNLFALAVLVSMSLENNLADLDEGLFF